MKGDPRHTELLASWEDGAHTAAEMEPEERNHDRAREVCPNLGRQDREV